MYSLLTGNKVSEAQANPNQILKKTVDNTSFESLAMNVIITKHFKINFVYLVQLFDEIFW